MTANETKHHYIRVYLQNLPPYGRIRFQSKTGERNCKDLHIQHDKCSRHEVGRGRCHDRRHQQSSHMILIFHMHIIGEVCCPSHQLQLFVAAEIR